MLCDKFQKVSKFWRLCTYNEFLTIFFPIFFRERPRTLCNNSAEETAIQVNNPLAEAIRPRVTANPAMTCGATAWSPPPSSPVVVILSGVLHQAPVEETTANVILPNYSLTSLVTFWENPPCKSDFRFRKSRTRTKSRNR